MELLPIIAGSLLVGALLGFVLGRTTGGKAPTVAALLALAAAGVLMLMGRAAQGWNGMGYAIVALLLAAPVAVGAALGGWLGAALRARRDKDPRGALEDPGVPRD